METVITAATYVEDHEFTPFDALHLVESNGDTIVSSDDTRGRHPSSRPENSRRGVTLRNH